MASSTAFLLVSVGILSLFTHLSSSLRDDSITNAEEILSSSGYISMSLVLQLVSQNLFSNASTATIFSPSDDAFHRSGQPSLSLLQLHISPNAYSFKQLQSLPFGSKIPTLSTNRSLFVTTFSSDGQISIDGVKIDGTPVFDDGLLIVFGMDKFFDLNFEILTPSLSPSPEFARYCPALSPNFEILNPSLSASPELARYSPASTPNFEILTPSLSPSPELARYSPASTQNSESPVWSSRSRGPLLNCNWFNSLMILLSSLLYLLGVMTS